MKWLMAIPVWSTPRDSLNRFNLVFSRCPYEESPLPGSFSLCLVRSAGQQRHQRYAPGDLYLAVNIGKVLAEGGGRQV